MISLIHHAFKTSVRVTVLDPILLVLLSAKDFWYLTFAWEMASQID